MAIVNEEKISESITHKIHVAKTRHKQTESKKRSFLVIVASFTEMEKRKTMGKKSYISYLQ